jgi:hypothetical protein
MITTGISTSALRILFRGNLQIHFKSTVTALDYLVENRREAKEIEVLKKTAKATIHGGSDILLPRPRA